MIRYGLIGLAIGMAACSDPAAIKIVEPVSDAVAAASKPEKPSAITQEPWQDVVINVTDFAHAIGLFIDIGGFEIRKVSDTSMILAAPGSDGSYIHLNRVPEDTQPTRPAESRAWDKGCYFSLMMRAKNLETIIADAKSLGWSPLTEMAYFEFGPSKLHIVVLTHESGLRVQLYERLTTPVPKAFPPFERLSRPFNIMQMVEDRDVSFEFFQQGLGFDTFFYGPPYVSEKEEIMPLGIPVALTTTIPYLTGIVTPKKGLEWGRMEMIDIEGMPDGISYVDQCTMDRTGIVAVRFPVDNLKVAEATLRDRDIAVTSYGDALQIKSPDGSNIIFFETETP